jgi:hypothetical protein
VIGVFCIGNFCKHPAKVRNSFIAPRQRFVGLSAVIVGEGVFRVELYGLVEVRERAVVILLVGVCTAAAVVGGCSELRVELYGLAVVGDGAVVLSFGGIGVAAVVVAISRPLISLRMILQPEQSTTDRQLPYQKPFLRCPLRGCWWTEG